MLQKVAMKLVFSPFKKLIQQLLASVALLSGLAAQSQPSLTVLAEPTNEGLIGLLVTFQLSENAVGGEQIQFNLIEGTATEDDYLSFGPNAVIDFPAGEDSVELFITMVDDDDAEADETFSIEISSPVGLTVNTPSTELTIVNDDLFFGEVAPGEIILPSFFSDGMVLQRETGAPFWGTVAPGAAVTVEFDNRVFNTFANVIGRFEVNIDNLVASSVGRELTVTSGGGSVTLNDVLVGEVWFCSGQSNMEFPFSFLPTPANNLEAANANDPLLRLYLPIEQARENPAVAIEGSWLRALPTDTPDFPVLPYFFGQRLRQELGVPVAIIECAWGGQRIEGFISRMPC